MDIENYFSTRQTIRSFSDKKINDSQLSKMISEAAKAPNTGNMQLYSVVATTSEEGKLLLAPLHFNQPCATDCAVLLTFCIDFNRFSQWCAASDAQPGFDNLQMLLAAAIDCSLFAQQFNTIAELNGLGCCYLGTTAYNAPKIAEVLDLPKGVIPLISIACGFPAENDLHGQAQDRLPVEAILHKEKYNHLSNAKVRELYAAKEERDDNKRFVKENGKQTLAQVFTDIRYPKQSNETFSRSLAEFITPYLEPIS
ncbi:MAG: nitroreductase family protein [Muribaculaceae bacterium]|nr:nitroreductase family protein [Muribaculaceae bacterium]